MWKKTEYGVSADSICYIDLKLHTDCFQCQQNDAVCAHCRRQKSSCQYDLEKQVVGLSVKP